LKNFFHTMKNEPKKRKIRRNGRLQPGHFYVRRLQFFYLLIPLIFTAITVRAVIVHLFPSSSKNLQAIANHQYHRNIELAPYRGGIFDRKREPLAISVRKPSLYVNPKIFNPTTKERTKLASLLGMPDSKIKAAADRINYFAWLKRAISQETADAVATLNIDGLYQVMEPARFYPSGSSAAQIIGYVGTDNRGLAGLELQYDTELKGQTIKFTNSRDARGKAIFLESEAAAPEEGGKNVFLTIDSVIQEISERALSEGVESAQAKAGYAIVSDPHTGRILAIANYPKFDPNHPTLKAMGGLRNRALSDLIEPGSVVKPLVIGAALADGKTSPTEKHYCENGTYREGRWLIRDTHPEKDLTTTGVITHSSNICTYKIARRLGPEAIYNNYLKYGLTSTSNNIEFPGQITGRISYWKDWKPVRFANVTFGQGLVTSALEMVQSYGAIANGGNLMKPYLVERVESYSGTILRSSGTQVVRKIMEPDVAKKLRHMLETVVVEGSGKNARLDHYTAAGKTGTTQKVDPALKKYSTDLRVASFIGFTPVEDPHLVIYVVIDEPGKKPYYGGLWAAPVFKKIAEESLKYLNVAPDKIETIGPGDVARSDSGVNTKVLR